MPFIVRSLSCWSSSPTYVHTVYVCLRVKSCRRDGRHSALSSGEEGKPTVSSATTVVVEGKYRPTTRRKTAREEWRKRIRLIFLINDVDAESTSCCRLSSGRWQPYQTMCRRPEAFVRVHECTYAPTLLVGTRIGGRTPETECPTGTRERRRTTNSAAVRWRASGGARATFELGPRQIVGCFIRLQSTLAADVDRRDSSRLRDGRGGGGGLRRGVQEQLVRPPPPPFSRTKTARRRGEFVI